MSALLTADQGGKTNCSLQFRELEPGEDSRAIPCQLRALPPVTKLQPGLPWLLPACGVCRGLLGGGGGAAHVWATALGHLGAPRQPCLYHVTSGTKPKALEKVLVWVTCSSWGHGGGPWWRQSQQEGRVAWNNEKSNMDGNPPVIPCLVFSTTVL